MSKRGDEAKVRAAAIALRRVEGQTGTQIATAMGVSRQRVYQMLKEHGYFANGQRVLHVYDIDKDTMDGVPGAEVEARVSEVMSNTGALTVSSVDAMQAERAMRAVYPETASELVRGQPVMVDEVTP